MTIVSETGKNWPEETPVTILLNLYSFKYLVKHVKKIIQDYSSPSLIRTPFLPRNCGHIREVAFDEKEK